MQPAILLPRRFSGEAVLCVEGPNLQQLQQSGSEGPRVQTRQPRTKFCSALPVAMPVMFQGCDNDLLRAGRMKYV